ncbi:MAG: UDP-N-acetylmuramoyl-tripeptide--D-alanyl-D-alanine ligase [Clostridia bacterium]|nr:UDP-N-acetylmuramoyl-tripeptide--D-alanyl-D-alanine ligase [Clostridia bacterium]
MSIIHVDKMRMSLAEIAKVTDGELFYSGSAIIRNISLDSREIEEGTLFVAIKGERFDGHDFIGKAFEDGAAAIICERIPYKVKGNVILVDNSLAAFGAIARTHKQLIKPLTVGITGSVGKTTTKQFISAVLASKYKTHKTDGNFNNEIGMPITILRMPCDTEALVLEMGMSFKGEISRLSKIAEPDIAVITNIGSSHIENFGSREGIRDAKMEIADGLNKKKGTLVLNGDEPLLSGVESAVYVAMNNESADYRPVNIVEGDGYFTFDIKTPDGIAKNFRINVLGIHNVYNAAVAYTVGKLAGVCDSRIREGLLNFENAAMRQNIYENKGYTIIEDCYNASPESMAASLSVLCAKAKQGRRVAVLGDMLELGEQSDILHYGVGKKAAEMGIELLFAFGPHAGKMAEGAISAGMAADRVTVFTDNSDAQGFAKIVSAKLTEGDTVLFKASRGMALERITKILSEE